LVEGKVTKSLPFCKLGIYPYFAVFATFYGTCDETKRYTNLSALANGDETFVSLVSLQNRAFLFYVYAQFCLNHPGSLARGWYNGKKTVKELETIKRWMEVDDSDTYQITADEAIVEHLEIIKDELDGYKAETKIVDTTDVFD
jgi:hypothetical protein